ncbi:cytochrome c biogenesis CcdA family protein [Spongiactinospora sp. TRM90649]|uniref:cytochrome c biogenesis CcdA family protein n=1 Tax=Spongiactinospora sp. TRM90649 TaxID=3031114 RepID=UPI0023F914F7|nr:cytochrome c biogenesis CcdA family protein [Spongiactinospora sp. TRM90649]MDF5757995.1 cytochrome c biogenesis CcdA family protein [Spongiactinospora sp. TRM90649]
MNDLPLALAMTAGSVAAFNPCGFALLPAYLSMLLADDRGGPLRALTLSAAMTAGFVTVFGLFGLVVTPLALSLGRYLPWVTIAVGLALLALGGWLLSGRELLLRVPALRTGNLSQYGYGLSYAVASLSCTVGPFLAIISASLTGGGILGGLAVFVAYALGMGLVITLLSLAVALARGAAVARMRRVLPYVPRISGALLVLAGLYVAYYGWYELRVFDGAAVDDLLIGTVTRLQGTVTGWLETLGPAWISLALAVLLLIAFAARRALRR